MYRAPCGRNSGRSLEFRVQKHFNRPRNHEETDMPHIRRPIAALAALACTLAALPAHASKDLADKKGCLACHGVDKRIAPTVPFPSYKEVAARYAGQKDAVDKLTKKVLEGGSGSWGTVPMVANKATVTEAEARQIVKWVLTVK